MTENNESTAGTILHVDEGDQSNMVHHPNDPQPLPDPVPDPPHAVAGDVTDAEIADLRESVLGDPNTPSPDTQDPPLVTNQDDAPQIIITLGEIVYYGDSTGAVHPAIITHVYGYPADNNEDRNFTYVDLQVFKRQHICNVEKVAQHPHGLNGPLNGWVFKA